MQFLSLTVSLAVVPQFAQASAPTTGTQLIVAGLRCFPFGWYPPLVGVKCASKNICDEGIFRAVNNAVNNTPLSFSEAHRMD